MIPGNVEREFRNLVNREAPNLASPNDQRNRPLFQRVGTSAERNSEDGYSTRLTRDWDFNPDLTIGSDDVFFVPRVKAVVLGGSRDESEPLLKPGS